MTSRLTSSDPTAEATRPLSGPQSEPSQAPRPLYQEPAGPPNLWARMASPWYVLGLGPWIALLALIGQMVVSSFLLMVASTLIGLLFLPLLAIGFGGFERWRLQVLGHGSLPDGHVPSPAGAGFGQWIALRSGEVATWRELGSLILSGLWGGIASILLLLEVGVLMLAGTLAFYMGLGQRSLYLVTSWGEHFMFYDQSEYSRLVNEYQIAPESIIELAPGYWWVWLVGGLFALIIFAYLNGLLAASGGSLSKLILSPRPEEQAKQLARMEASRTKIVDAFEGERRRIERNLHDGVQQELVNLNLRLGLAEMEAKALLAGREDDQAQSLLNHLAASRSQLAHAQTTLRDTVRGIYPPVLEDYGLKAALDELVRYSVLPVSLDFYAPGRLPRDVERTAYYTVNEALTNVLKHAEASQVRVLVERLDDALRVVVEDNGRGGASMEAGTGLAGLQERAAVLKGHIQLVSPAGGPTRLTLILPL